VRTNTGAEQRIMLPLHGTIANAPATHVSVRVGLRPPYELAVIGQVRDTAMFGPSLELRSTVSTLPGSREFAVSDVVENVGGTPAELELLYHCNYGPPLLGEGSRLLAPVRFVCPWNKRAAEGMPDWNAYGPPEPGFIEQCYCLRLHGDQDGRSLVALLSPDERLAATIRYSIAQLPAFTIWKNTAAEQDGYVTGLEPGTDYPNPRAFERKHGRVITLPAGGTHEARLAFGLVVGADEVAQLRSEVAALGEGKECVVHKEPDAGYCPT
jgi:hypothetical protein